VKTMRNVRTIEDNVRWIMSMSSPDRSQPRCLFVSQESRGRIERVEFVNREIARQLSGRSLLLTNGGNWPRTTNGGNGSSGPLSVSTSLQTRAFHSLQGGLVDEARHLSRWRPTASLGEESAFRLDDDPCAVRISDPRR